MSVQPTVLDQAVGTDPLALVIRNGQHQIIFRSEAAPCGMVPQTLNQWPYSTLREAINAALQRVDEHGAEWLEFYDSYVAGTWPLCLVVGQDMAILLHREAPSPAWAHLAGFVLTDSGEVVKGYPELLRSIPRPYRRLLKTNARPE
jgi:hypothetical protein